MFEKPIGIAAIFIAVTFIATTVASFADEIRPCKLVPDGVSVISGLDSAPRPVAMALKERVGEVVPVGASFDSTDLVRIGKSRRLVFIWNRGTRWVIATEHGGLGYNDPVFAFEFTEGSDRATFVREELAFPNTICSTASSLLVIGYPP
jgi:hypothetical protein